MLPPPPEHVMLMGGPAHGKMAFSRFRYVSTACLAWPDGFYEFCYELTAYRRADGSFRWLFRPRDNIALTAMRATQ